jgi:transcription elongation factor GreB
VSRAFVDESAQQPHEEDAPELKIALPPGARNYSTPRGAERLRAELADLEQVQRPRLASAIGQLHDTDSDDLAAQRRKLREMDRRIEYLMQMCSRLEVIDPAGQRSDRVVFGATVSVRDTATGAERTYRIVGVDEADPEKGSLSWVSPVARALVSARVGDTVSLKLPAGSTTLEVTGIRFE